MGGESATWQGVKTFRFTDRRYDVQSGTTTLTYAFDEGEPLIERITFPYAPWPPEASRQLAFEAASKLLHLVAGVSYFKAAVPGAQSMDHGSVTEQAAGFLNELYIHGLAEFAYINKVDLAPRVHFETMVDESPANDQATELVLPNRALVAMGGGKDSIVALTMLQTQGLEVQPVCVGNAALIEETTRAAGLPLLRIERELAPELAVMNRAGALNGHVPVTAINSAILVCAAILYGYKYVVFGNERSADEETLIGDSDVPVNHQYSKSSSFESAFREIVRQTVSPDIEYFSILRPYAELDVVRRFSVLSQYHRVFSSCNRNFHQDGSRIEGRWCGDCPKCRFAALSLAVFLPPETVIEIQGRDLLNEVDQSDGFRALCRLGTEKPFECVGETGECRAAFLALAGNEKWKNHAVVRQLVPELTNLDVPHLDELLKPTGQHFIPPALVPDDLLNERAD